MSRLTQFAVREKSVIVLLAFGLLFAGLFSWGQLRQELLPDIELPFVTVITPLPGAGAEDVATQVSEPIERSLANVPRLETIQSTSANSLSLVFAQFAFGTDLKETLAEVESQVRQLDLPEGGEPQVSSFDFNDQPVIIATVSPLEGADQVEASRFARQELVPALQGIEGVSTVDLTGGPTPILDIVLDPEAMADAGISLQQVQGVTHGEPDRHPRGLDSTRAPCAFRSRPSINSRRSTSSKSLIVGAKQPDAAAAGAGTGEQPGGDTPADDGSGDEAGLGGVLAGLPTPVTLGEIAAIEQRDVQVSGYARTNGQPSLTLSITKRSGANTVDVADQVQAAFDDAVKQHPDIIPRRPISDQSTFIKESRDGLVQEGLLGALFAVIVIYGFLRSARTTLVAAISIPLSIIDRDRGLRARQV